MRRHLLMAGVSLVLLSCKQEADNIRGIPTQAAVKKEILSIQDEAGLLEEEGYQVFTYEEEDSTVLMQQYYLVLLKKGKNRNQDSLTAANLQEQHLKHLNRMYKEGYASLAGPIGADGELRGIVIYNTRTLKEADSLAHLDPMVQAGRLEVETLPWWAAKGGKLK